MPESADAVLRRLYAEVLALERAGDDEGFFALGGSSLHAVRLLERVHEQLGVTVELESFFREPSLLGLLRAAARRRADLVAPLVEAAHAGPADRPALVGPDGQLSYAELADLVGTAAKEADPAAGPVAVRAENSVSGACEVITALAAQRPLLLLDPSATAAEQQSARQTFAAEPLPEVSRAVHAIATSGSTGRPKVVVSRNDGMLALQHAHVSLLGLGPADTCLVMAPLHYCFGLKAGMLVGLLSGATVVLPPQPLRPDALRDCVARHRITTTLGVSFAYRMLLATDAELPALHTAMIGGDRLSPDVASAWRERAPVPLTDGYGCTETDHISNNTEGVPGSVGAPLPGVELRVRRPDGTVAESGTGELLVHSPAVALGYAGDPQRTAERFTDGWYATGDTVELDSESRIFLHGRVDDQLNVAGAKVDPHEVEQVCREELGLSDCVVTGTTGATGVTELRAYVVSEHPVTREELVRAVSGRLSAYKIPGRVVRLDRLPRSESGKLRYGELP